MRPRTQVGILAAYALAAVVTFGPAFVRIEAAAKARCVEWKTQYCTTDDIAGLGAMLSAMGWPLYWSVQIARTAKDTQP